MIKLDQIVPFGRSYTEYCLMFNLTTLDLQKKILGCGDGPASFNAEMRAKGYTVTSIDPIYQFSGHEIEQRFYAVIDSIIAQVEATPENWTWSYHRHSKALRHNRIQVMKIFQSDYERGKAENRYQIQSLPQLSYDDQEFDLVLCSHLLFLYSDLLSFDFHLHSLQELCRVAKEVRIFPLLSLNQQVSPYLDPIRANLQAQGIQSQIETVKYELQKGGNQMLRLFR